MSRLTSTRSQAGFTLVELLVAMVIGLLVMGGATQLFISSQQSFRFQTALADMQDTGRFALDTMAMELRQTDFSGGCVPSLITSHLRNIADTSSPALSLQAWHNGTGSDFFNDLSRPVTNQDMLAFRGGLIARTGLANESLSIESVESNQQLTLNRDIGSIFDERLSLLQGLQNCDIFYNTSDKPRTLQKANITPWGANSGLTYNPGQDVSLSALNSAIYYIGLDSDNNDVPSLMRLDLSQTTPRNDIVASHVIAMRTAFLLDEEYLSADKINIAQWPEVRALRISLIVQSDRDNLRNIDTTLAVGNFRGEDAFTANGGRLYQAFTTTIALRNR